MCYLFNVFFFKQKTAYYLRISDWSSDVCSSDLITFLIVMGQTVAASTTFPLLFLAIYWKGLTAAGAIAAGLFGLVTSVGGIVMGPAFWVKALGNEMPIIPTDYPALVTEIGRASCRESVCQYV